MKPLFRRFVGSLLEAQVKQLILRHNLTVVAVVGSVGKTTTKMAIARTLSARYRVMVQEDGNYNSEIGLPLMVFGLSAPAQLLSPWSWIQIIRTMRQQVAGNYPYDVLVLELGTDHPGEIPHFMTYLRPDIGVVTAITPEHMENFASLDEVAQEELALLPGCKQALINADDVPKRYLTRLQPAQAPATYGLSDSSEYAVVVGQADLLDGCSVTLKKGTHAAVIGLGVKVYGEPALKAVAAAYAVADIMGLDHHQIEDGLGKVVPVKGRLNPLPGKNQSIILDDSYNSSPEAVVAALQALRAVAKQRQPGRRIAVLGSMNELGADSERYHREAGAAAAEVDLLVTVGQAAHEWLGAAAVQAGLAADKLVPFDSPYAAGAYLAARLAAGDVILVKGSQNRVFTEETAKLLLADPADAARLVRQSEHWSQVKRSQFADAPASPA